MYLNPRIPLNVNEIYKFNSLFIIYEFCEPGFPFDRI